MHPLAYCVRIMTKLFILFMNTNIIVIEIPLFHTLCLVVYNVEQRVYRACIAHATHIIV